MGGGALSNTWDTARAISAGTSSLLHPPQGEPSLGAQFFLESALPSIHLLQARTGPPK